MLRCSRSDQDKSLRETKFVGEESAWPEECSPWSLAGIRPPIAISASHRLLCLGFLGVGRSQSSSVSGITVEHSAKLGLALFIFLLLTPTAVSVRAESAPCQSVSFEHNEYTVCQVDLRRQSVRLFWKKPDGR